MLQTRDGNASSWNDISDVPPQLRRELFHFFRTYKARGRAGELVASVHLCAIYTGATGSGTCR